MTNYESFEIHEEEEKKGARLPLFAKLALAFTPVSVVLYILFVYNTAFADDFNATVAHFGRVVLATLTSWIPFSVAELFILLIPLWFFLLIRLAYRRYCASWRDALRYIGLLLACACTVFNIFVWNFAPGYYARPLEEKLELQREKSSAAELYETAELLADELRQLTPEITFLPSGASLMPYSYEEMNAKLLKAYERLSQKYSFIQTFHSKAKPVMLSEPMSYTHITGVYTFFTGEANLNVNFPDYTLPYTAAHELAHQRGIAREDEANFVAFLVCMESDDPYIRYSGYLNTYEYVAGALSSASRELYKKSYAELPAEIHAEERAYSIFFEKYRENVAANVSQAVNNAYLQSQGAPEGTRSYNLVVDLAVAYYRQAKAGT